MLFNKLPVIALLFGTITSCAQQQTKLIIRADDMGVTHAANLACIDVYSKGIARSVEVMVPTPWYLEAVQFLQNHPDYDAGIHLVITCEWTNLKWRPLTHANSLTDSNGYFFPTIWKGAPNYPSLRDHQPDFKEAEMELRAQIESAKKHLPWLSHISTHMGFEDSNPEFKKIVEKLSKEYGLPILNRPVVDYFPSSEKMKTNDPDAREAAFIESIGKLEKGKTYLFVAHPCYDTQEMETVNTPDYKNVGADRNADLKMLTSEKVKKALEQHSVKLISIRGFINKTE